MHEWRLRTRISEIVPNEALYICPYQEKIVGETQIGLWSWHSQEVSPSNDPFQRWNSIFRTVRDDSWWVFRFKEGSCENNCEQVAVESTGVYWVPIHTVLEEKIEVIIANAYKIKQSYLEEDRYAWRSEWIAELCTQWYDRTITDIPKRIEN